MAKFGTGMFLLNFMAGFAKKVGGCGWFLIVSGGFGGFRLVPPFSMYHYLHVANVLNKTTIRLCNYQESLGD